MTRSKARSTVTLDKARSALSRIWFVGSGVVFLLLVAQSMGTVYGAQVKEVWSWALPGLVPSLSLIVTVLGSTALARPGERQPRVTVRRTYYRLATWLSCFYLFLVLATILSQPVVVAIHPEDDFQAIDVLEMSHLWLAPLQGLVISAMGVLFFSRREPTTPAS